MKLKTTSLILFVLFLITGFSFFKPGPEKILTLYLDSQLKGQSSDAYQYLSVSDKATESKESFSGEANNEYTTLIQSMKTQVSYKIIDIKINKDKAAANVDITMPDYKIILADVMGEVFKNAFSEKKDDNIMMKTLEKKYKNKSMPMVTEKNTFNLVKEKNEWKVFLDLKKNSDISKLTIEATNFESKKDYLKAKERYQEIYNMDSKNAIAKEKIDELGKKVQMNKTAKAYMDKVSIQNIEVSESVLGGMGVFGEIKNNGDKSLKEVEITLYFLDSNKKPIYESKHYPVLVTTYSFSRDNEPLKPNYVRKFGYNTDKVPSEWSNNIRAKVTNITFE